MTESPAIQARPRISFIDSARGVAAFLVLFQHSYERFFPSIGEFIGSQFVNFGQVGVVIFFLVSGFIIPFSLERSRSYQQFFVNRAFRIYPLYFFVILLQLVLIFSHIRQLSEGSTWFTIGLSHLFFAQEYFPLSSRWSENLVMGSWTLFIEAVWYVLFASLFFLKLKHNRILWLAISFFLLVSVAGFILEKRLPMGRMGMLYNCILGLHAYRYFKSEISYRFFLSGFLAGFAVLVFGLWVAFGHFISDSFTFGCVLISWSLAYSIFGFFFAFRNQTLRFFESGLSFLGTISYSVYLMHFTILMLVMHYFEPSPMLFLATIVVVVLVSKLSYTWIEKPGIDFGKSWLKKKNW